MTYAFHPDARVEYREAASFYESERPGLGAAFTREVEATVERILAAPDGASSRTSAAVLLTYFHTASCTQWKRITFSSSQLLTGAGSRATGVSDSAQEKAGRVSSKNRGKAGANGASRAFAISLTVIG
jgi:hypothetical protein